MNPKELKPGVYCDVPFEEYLKWPAASNTILGIIDDQSPAHAKEQMDHPGTSEAFEVGQAFHKLNLEAMSFEDRYAVLPEIDKRTKAGKETYEKFLESVNGKQIISRDDYNTIIAMTAAIEHHPKAKRFIWGGDAEVSICWYNEEFDILCKCRLDYHHADGVIIDLKSTRDASEKAFSKAIYNYGYHRQAAWYLDGSSQYLKADEFCFVAVEKTPPYGVAVYIAADDVIDAGRQAYQRPLKIYAECVKTGVWPGYSKDFEYIHLPSWALVQEGIGDRRTL